MSMRGSEVYLKANEQGSVTSEINNRAKFERALFEDRS